MSNQTIPIDDRLYAYLIRVSLREPGILRRLREETARLPEHGMQTAPEEAQFLAFLAKLIGARRCLEIGVFTGYSSLWVVSALPQEARLRALDVSEAYTSVARRYWREAGVEDRIDLRLGPAMSTLDAMMKDGESGTYDFVFIDADKVNYLHYYESALHLLRPGGIITIDNVLWGGAVADPANHEGDTVAIRKFNDHLHQDGRIDLSLVPIGDGLTVARKRA
jgi:predicted O-methyltransferase YrrM